MLPVCRKPPALYFHISKNKLESWFGREMAALHTSLVMDLVWSYVASCVIHQMANGG